MPYDSLDQYLADEGVDLDNSYAYNPPSLSYESESPSYGDFTFGVQDEPLTLNSSSYDSMVNPTSTAPAEDSSWGLGGLFKDFAKAALPALVSSAPGIYNAYNQNETNKEALAQREMEAKYNALMELAKLKYQTAKGSGGGRGGGGGGGSRDAAAANYISSVLRTAEAKSAALNSLQQAFQSIYRGS